MKFNGSFGDWLRQHRKALDLTQRDLADQAGCAEVTIRQIERGVRRPSRQIAERMADVLAIAPEERTAFMSFARRLTDKPPAVPIELSSSLPAHNLPPQPTMFIGREQELAQISKRLANPACRLLTLVGPGGIGKTRLALQAAVEHIGNFAHGVYFVALASVNSPDLIAPTIATALKISLHGAEDPGVQIVNFLRVKQMLLVLDNFEHLLGGSGLLTEILANAPAVKILVTSRERLNIQEEWGIALEGLRFPEARATDQIESYSAVQLFVQRAGQVQVSFSLDANIQPVIDICKATEGMPLGIELAATWLRVMSCKQIAAQIERSLDFLANPLRNVPERHRSLRAVFDHSWSLLAEDERMVLMKLSVFRGGFDLEAAEQVAGASLPTLARLVDKSLIRLGEAGRYELHELLRQYANDKLVESGEAEAVAHHHLAFFLKLAQQAETYLYGPHQETWFDRLELERDNLAAALARSLRQGEEEMGLCLVAALVWYWELRAHHYEGYSWCRRLLEITSNAPYSERAKVLAHIGWYARYFEGEEQAMAYVEEALALAREADNKGGIAWALGAVDEPRQVACRLEEALALFRAIGDEFGVSHMLRRRAWKAICQADYARAGLLLDEALALARKAGDKNATAWTLFLLGNLVWFSHHDTVRATALYQESLSLSQAIRDRGHLAYVQTMCGHVARVQGDCEIARARYMESLALVRDWGARDILFAECCAGLAGLAAAWGEPERAARLLGAAYARLSRGVKPPLSSPAEFDQDVSAVRALLGEAAFETAWAEGQAMSHDQAVAYALTS
jgi:predicted ATPase/DNA-binding XRE family transcriptional regulator